MTFKYLNHWVLISIRVRVMMTVGQICGSVAWRAVPSCWKGDSAIHHINLYPVDSAIGFPNTYPLDTDLSTG